MYISRLFLRLICLKELLYFDIVSIVLAALLALKISLNGYRL